MAVIIHGRLVEPADDRPRTGVTLVLTTLKNSTVVLKHAVYQCVTGSNGEYSFKAEPGVYAVSVSVYGAEPERVGVIRVYEDSVSGSLNTFLLTPDVDDLTPEILRQLDRMYRETQQAAEKAKHHAESAAEASTHIAKQVEQVTAAQLTISQQAHQVQTLSESVTQLHADVKSRHDAVMNTAQQVAKIETTVTQTAQDVTQTAQHIAEDAAQVAQSMEENKHYADIVKQSASVVETQTQQVSMLADSVRETAEQMTTVAAECERHSEQTKHDAQRVEVLHGDVVKKQALAMQAAETASEKAVSAATLEASAAEHARQAKAAAQVTTGALTDGGAVDLSTGRYPDPVSFEGVKRSTFWKVTVGGHVGNIEYGVGDTLIYTTAGGGEYYKIDNSESVSSVQGEKGAVTLTPEKIGADVAGTADALMSRHMSMPKAHAMASIDGLLEALATHYSPDNLPSLEVLGAEGKGVAARILQQHVESADPHVQYAKRTEVDAKGSAVQAIETHTRKAGAHTMASIAGLEAALAQKVSAQNVVAELQKHKAENNPHPQYLPKNTYPRNVPIGCKNLGSFFFSESGNTVINFKDNALNYSFLFVSCDYQGKGVVQLIPVFGGVRREEFMIYYDADPSGRYVEALRILGFTETQATVRVDGSAPSFTLRVVGVNLPWIP